MGALAFNWKGNVVGEPSQEQISERVIANEDAPAQQTVERGAKSCNVSQVAIAATPTLIRVRNECRRGIKITQLGANDVYIGFSPSVNVNSGDLLVGTRGASVTIPTVNDVWAICVAGALSTVSYMEVSD